MINSTTRSSFVASMMNSIKSATRPAVKLALIIYLFCFTLQAQNLVSVPFGNGFVGINAGNAVSNNSYYLTGAQGIGWSNLQFAQTTNSNVFVAQGNDIVGMVMITDFNGVQHTINGFIKWRTPSGNNPHTMVFQPSSGSFVLATNGAYGFNTYTIDATKYIGLTRLGQTLTITPIPGTVSGNASTSGLLDALNSVYTALSRLSISGTTVMESAGVASVSVSLDVASSDIITVNFFTENYSAISPADYTTKDTILTFSPGQLSKTITIPIVVDAVAEPTENFKIKLRNATNASVSKSLDSVIVLESALPVEFLGMNYTCKKDGGELSWTVASEQNAAVYKVDISDDGYTWETGSIVPAQGTMHNEFQYTSSIRTNCPSKIYYLRLLQVDINGASKTLGELTIEGCEFEDFVQVYPNPTKGKLSVSLNLNSDSDVEFILFDTRGKVVFNEKLQSQIGFQLHTLNIEELINGNYQLVIKANDKVFREQIVLEK